MARPSALEGGRSASPIQFLKDRARRNPADGGRTLVIAAHPDDEAIGIGGHLSALPDPWVLYVTDGAPRHGAFAAAAGFASPIRYAQVRRKESIAAAKVAGIPENKVRELGIADQEVCYQLPKVVEALKKAIGEIAPSLVVTHPYEGGHPDHDATALAVWAALKLLKKHSGAKPSLVEFTSYHNSPGGLEASDFLRYGNSRIFSAYLSEAQRSCKSRMFHAYRTQQQVLQAFPIALERFRLAPSYDFTRPPHAGKLYYETFDWGIDGARWRSEALAALRQLGLSH